jgi:hypothetical protein
MDTKYGRIYTEDDATQVMRYSKLEGAPNTAAEIADDCEAHGTPMKFPKDEPIFVLRAQDGAALATLHEYYDACKELDCEQPHLDGIRAAIDRFSEWQQERGTKVPD